MNILLKLIGGVAALAALSACSSDGLYFTGVTESGFKTPTSGPDAEIPVDLENEQNGNVYNSMFGGAAFVSGTNSSGARAYAGIIPDSNPGAVVTSGKVNYDTQYSVVGVENVSSGNLVGDNFAGNGTLTVVADFNAQTFNGANATETFAVEGVISGQDMTGTVTYKGLPGVVEGLVGEDAIIGAFHGSTLGTVFSGGFLGTSTN